jgi:hypothetical protein
MGRYLEQSPPSDPAGLGSFIGRELQEVSRALSEPNQFLLLDTSYAAPSKPREGMIVLADGVSWSPSGLGAGFYGYRGGSWNKLG